MVRIMPKNSRRDGFIPLSEADWKFCSASLREEYWQLHNQPEPEFPEPNNLNWAEGMKVLSKSLSHALRTGPAITKMQNEVANKLRMSELEARGLRTKPTFGEDLETIPDFYFDRAKIDWKKNAVENFGRRFEAVEVRRPSKRNRADTQEITASAAADPTIEKRRGRPSAEDTIMNAIAVLANQGFDFRACGRKEGYEAIRHHLRKAHYDVSRGFSDPVLNRFLTRYLRQN
jgi:hypothetical protein